MPQIIVYNDPLKLSNAEINAVECGCHLIDWMSKNVNIDELGCSVFLNGFECSDIDKLSTDEFVKSLDFYLNNNDSVTIIMKPRGADPYTLIIIAIIAIAVSIALTPKPQIPNNLGKLSSSPNNQLNSSTNQYRPRQAIPDISGQVISYPDFIQPSYYEYVNNLKIFKEIFCIGVGQYDISNVKTGDTLLDDIEGASYTIHTPGNIPSELLFVRGTNDIDGIEIIAPNDDSILGDIINGTLTSATSRIDVGTGTAPSELGIFIGATVNISVNYTQLGGSGTTNLSGDFEVLAFGSDYIEIDSSIDDSEPNANGFYINKSSPVAGQWFTLQGDQIEEIWFQLQMPQGIRSSIGESLTVDLTLTVEELDSFGVPTGTTTTSNVSISGNTQNSLFRTFKITSLTESKYRAKVERTTDKEIGGIDLVKLENIQSVTSYSGSNFGDVTLIEVDRRGTTFATSQRQSKINALVTRKLELFDSVSKSINNGVFTATRAFSDYVLYVLHQQAGIQIEDIDTDSLFNIYDNLSDPQLGYFDFTFDDNDVSLKERIQTACNVARVKYYNLPSPSWNFVREEENQTRVAMFNRRNIIANQSTQSYKFQRTSDYDSVSIRYVDPASNSETVVNRKWNGSLIVEGVGDRINEIDLAGCRSSIQAINRADLEIRKLIYLRRQVQDVFMSDGLFIGIGDRIQWADPNDSEIFSGEILGFNENNYDTSEKFSPEIGKTYYVNITDQNGAVIGNTVIASRRSDTEFGFNASGLTGVYLADMNNQLGSRYIIYEQNELTDLIVVSIGSPDQQNNVSIEAIEYRSEIFEND